MNRNLTFTNPSEVVATTKSATTQEAKPNESSLSAFNITRSETRLLHLIEVIRRTGLGKTKIYELQKAGTFPRSVHVTRFAVRWVDCEIEDWLRAQMHARPDKLANSGLQR